MDDLLWFGLTLVSLAILAPLFWLGSHFILWLTKRLRNGRAYFS